MAHRLGTSSSDIVTAVDYLRSGGVVGVPTETVYGLAALAFNVDAVSEIYRLKGPARQQPSDSSHSPPDQDRAAGHHP